MEEEYKRDTGLLVLECLIRAIEARTPTDPKLPEKDRATLVQRDEAEGFVFTGYFYEQLRKFEKANTGHHHLLVDTDLSDVKLDAPLPATDKIVHFGKGQTETTLTLAPGKHTLELLFADYTHLSFDPPLHSKKITITVE